MNKAKNQKGAISLFVLLSMMFFLAFMLGAFTLVNRRNAVQVESLRDTQAIYNSALSADDIYDSIFNVSDSVIPVSNKQQLATIVQVTADASKKINYMINGEVYTYKKDANYYLANDIILNLKDEVHLKNNITIYDYILYSGSYKIDLNGHNIYYAKDDGSLWKCIAYQNIGASKNVLFNSTNQGASYKSNLYSIIDNEIPLHKRKWGTDTEATYEFLLMYNLYNSGKFSIEKDESGKFTYNRWRQGISPIDASTKTDSAQDLKYKALEICSTNQNWGGLALSTRTETYLDGSIASNSWFYAVGVKTAWSTGGGIPGTNGGGASEYLLFIRVK